MPTVIWNMESKGARPFEIALHQPESVKARQASHLLIYLSHEIPRRFAREQSQEESFDLFRAFDPCADRNPIEFEQLSRQNPRPARFEQQLARMIEIPCEMSALLLGDPFAENFENRVVSVLLEVFVSA